MSDSKGAGAATAAAGFAERHGINRPRSFMAAALLGFVLLVSLFVMNQRIKQRRDAAAESRDSTVLAPAVEAGEASAPRAAWADPLEARRLAGDTLPAVPRTDDTVSAGDYVPLGRDVGPEGYSGVARGAAPGGPVSDADPSAGSTVGSPPGESVADASPEEMRRAGFRRAVSSRRLRAGRADEDGRAAADSAGGPAFPAAPATDRGATAGARDTAAALRPYGAEQAEEDRRAAERAAQDLVKPRPQALAVPAAPPAVRFVFAAAARPCRQGERVLSAGSVITATLASSINSETPGPVLARVGRDVYDAALRCVIFPAGTLLVGRYAEGLGAGEQRLVVVWEQAVLGDGRSWTLPALPGADRQGAVGIAGRVDRRTRETFETAALLSAFGAAIAYATPGGGQSQPAQPGGYPAAPSARDRAVGAATEPFRGAAERLLDRAAGIRPVLRLDMGQPIAVIVPRTVDLDRPAPPPADSLPAAPRPPAPQS
jgi:type IV secretion system protein VirB10